MTKKHIKVKTNSTAEQMVIDWMQKRNVELRHNYISQRDWCFNRFQWQNQKKVLSCQVGRGKRRSLCFRWQLRK